MEKPKKKRGRPRVPDTQKGFAGLRLWAEKQSNRLDSKAAGQGGAHRLALEALAKAHHKQSRDAMERQLDRLLAALPSEVREMLPIWRRQLGSGPWKALTPRTTDAERRQLLARLARMPEADQQQLLLAMYAEDVRAAKARRRRRQRARKTAAGKH